MPARSETEGGFATILSWVRYTNDAMRFQDIPENERALTFPTSFLVKALGLTGSDMESVVVAVLDGLDVEYARQSLSVKNSKKGKYASVSVSITATSREELDLVYDHLNRRDEVLMTM